MFRVVTTAGHLPQALLDRQAEFKAAREWVRLGGPNALRQARAESGQPLSRFPVAAWTRLPA